MLASFHKLSCDETMIIREETDEHKAHCKEISIYVFPEKKLRRLSPNFNIHVSVSVGDLYIATIGPTLFSCSRICRPILGIHK